MYWQSQSQDVPVTASNEPITALRCSEAGLRSPSVLKEHVDPTLALHVSFMAFNMKQNIIIQHDMTSLSAGVELWEWEKVMKWVGIFVEVASPRV